MKKSSIHTIANVVSFISFALSFVGLCGAIISTLSAFTTMVYTGTAGMAIAQFFLEG